LHFGPTLQEYYLPDVLLQKLEKIPSRDPWTGKIHLADVDASVGHVLIHFLHTGVYQTLKDEGVETTGNTQQDIVLYEFQTALLVLEAAKKYGVLDLQDLAQIELERRGKDMCLRDAVRVIREDLIVGPSSEHAWLRDYIAMKVRSAFEHDTSAILAPDFFDSIGSPTLTKWVAQIIVGLYSEEVNTLRREKTAAVRIPAPGHDELQGPCSPDIAALPSKRTSEGPNGWPTSVQKFGAFDDSSAAWGPHDLAQDGSSSQEADAPAALPSGIEEDSHATEREDFESWGSDKDKVETQHMQAEQATIAQSQEGDDAADNSTVTKDEEDGAGGEPLWSSLGSLAKKKKKSRVNTGCSTPPVWPPHLQLEVDPTLVILDVDTDAPVVSAGQEHPETEKDSYAGLGMSKRKKLKAKLDKEAKLKEEEDAKRQKEEEKAAEIRRQEEEEAEWIRLEEEEAELRRMEEEEAAAAAAAEAEAELERMKRMEEKRMRLEEEEAELKSMEEEEAAAAAAAEAEKCKKMEEKEANPWTEFPVAPLKKTKKKKSKESELTTKKKKKSRKPEVIRLAEDEENKEIRRERDNVAAAATTTDLSVVDSAGATFGDDDCRLRVEHLSQNFGWQDCEPCQLYIQKIAMKLHSEGLPIEDGFNTIN
jgi:hypothetical protein